MTTTTINDLPELAAAILALSSLPDVERARQAEYIRGEANRLLPQMRRAALYAATRAYGSRLAVAAELGVTPGAISIAIGHHVNGN